MKRKQRRLIPVICILIFFLCSLPWVFLGPIRQDLTVEMYYRQADDGIAAQLFWGENGELSANRCSDGNREGNIVLFSLSQNPEQVKMLRIDPSNTDAAYSITHFGFLLNGQRYLEMNAAQILDAFVPVNASLSLSGEELFVTPVNADSGLLIDSETLAQSTRDAAAQLRREKVRERFFLSALLTALLLTAVRFSAPLSAFFLSFFRKGEDGRFDWFSLTACAVLFGALLATAAIGLFSDLGMHPDEWDVKACLDYGMTHFFPPDMRDPEVARTYSGYGYTKLENYTWYFFLAGKIARLSRFLFCSVPYYRVPNLLLFLLMTVLFLRHIRQKKWIMAAFGICAQAWYLFSYTTADALDFVWSFLAVFLLADRDSLLYRTIFASGRTHRRAAGIVLLGLLYGMIALGKPNYLSILALTFFVLLFLLLQQPKGEKRRLLWCNYLCILGVCAAVWLTRAGFDLAYYGPHKAEIKTEMALQYADYDKNPATPIEEQNSSWHMYERGASLSDLFRENPEWFSMSYKSFCGLIQDRETGLWYYLLMGLLYTGLLLSAGISAFRGPTKWDRLEFAAGALLMLGGVLASIANSYLIDSQAQGRYLLPLPLIVAYLFSQRPRLLNSVWFRAALLSAGILSAGYFCLAGVPLFL